MATRFHTARRRVRAGDDFGTVIAEYVREAEAGRALDAAGHPYSPAALRSLRRALVHVEAALGSMPLHAVDDMDSAVVDYLARQVLADARLSPSRLDSIVDALSSLVAYATRQRPADPPRWEPPVRRPPADLRRWEHPVRQRSAAPPPRDWLDEPAPRPVGDREARAPTDTMLALGAQVGTWVERIIVIAFVLTAIGLALAFV